MRLLRCALGPLAAASLVGAQAGLMLRYPLSETTGTIAHDVSGNGHDGTILGGPQMMGAGGLRLDGIDDHVRLPDNIMQGLTAMTVSLQVQLRPEQEGHYFFWGMGRTGPDGDGDGYAFATGNPLRAAISPSGYGAEAESRAAEDLPRDTKWRTVTYVIDSANGGVSRLYLDGREVAGRTSPAGSRPIVGPGSIGGGTTQQNYIGRSQYVNDSFLAGSVRDFRIYPRALSTAEVVLLLAPDSAIDAAIGSITITNVDDVRGNLHLPNSYAGFNVNWGTSNPAIISTTGVVERPPGQDANITLLAVMEGGGERRERTFLAQVRARPAMGVFEGYAFAYFNLDREAIHMAASKGNNALDYQALGRAQPLLQSTMGTRGLRDPFIIRSPEGDTFYMMATDLNTGSGFGGWDASVRTGSHYIEVWESHDLVHWSGQRHVSVAGADAGNAWGPEAFYDDEMGHYVVFWSSHLYDQSQDPLHTETTSYHRMLYSTTRDFVTFSDPQLWQDAGMSRIDSTVFEDDDGVFYRFTKDEDAGETGCNDIIEETSMSLTAPLNGWTMVDGCIARDAGLQGGVEGPIILKSNPGDVRGNKFYLFVDDYRTTRGYVPLETTNLTSGRWQISSGYNLPGNPRQGTIIPVTTAELKNLIAELG